MELKFVCQPRMIVLGALFSMPQEGTQYKMSDLTWGTHNMIKIKIMRGIIKTQILLFLY
jgi:hypothetical protein